jgi:perosamine synthetase
MSPPDSLPALLGGPPIRPQGPPPWPPPDEDIVHALQAVYADGSWGRYHGNYVERLETVLRGYHQVPFALACGSGTFAVELALRALRIGAGDEVILAAYDYPGNFLSVHAVGAMPVLVDVDRDNWNFDPNRLTAAVGPNVKAIIVSHLHAGMVPMRELTNLAKDFGLAVIEDAAQVPGAMVQGQKAGTWGDVAILSFGGSKLLTSGRGGALLTKRADVYQRARTHFFRGNQLCPLSELQAAVLLPQLEKLDQRNDLRAGNVRRLCELVRGIPGIRPFVNRTTEVEPGYYKLGFQFDQKAFGLERSKAVAALRAEGIAFDEGFHALHIGRSPRRYRAVAELPEAERAHAGCLVLHHPVLLGDAADIEQVAAAVRKIHQHAPALDGPLAG